MRRVHGPYPHRDRWRLIVVDEQGKQVAESYASEEAAKAALEAHNEELRFEALAMVIARTAVSVPESPTWVYFLHDDAGAIVYVGTSTALTRRIQSHRDSKEDFRSASCIPAPFARADALRLEAALVKALRPRLNVALQLAGNFFQGDVTQTDLSE